MCSRGYITIIGQISGIPLEEISKVVNRLLENEIKARDITINRVDEENLNKGLFLNFGSEVTELPSDSLFRTIEKSLIKNGSGLIFVKIFRTKKQIKQDIKEEGRDTGDFFSVEFENNNYNIINPSLDIKSYHFETDSSLFTGSLFLKNIDRPDYSLRSHSEINLAELKTMIPDSDST